MRVFITIILIFSVLLSAAAAGTSTEGGNSQYDGDTELAAQLNALPPFKFEKHKESIKSIQCTYRYWRRFVRKHRSFPAASGRRTAPAEAAEDAG